MHRLRIRLALLLALMLPATILSIPAGKAAASMGRLVIWAYDAVNGIRIIDICTSVTLPGETTPIEAVDGDYPVGTYDVLVESCDGTYKPVLFKSVDVVSNDTVPPAVSGATVLDAFMDLNDRAVVTGRVVDSYSGYPLRDITVRLYALDGTPLDYATTDRYGRYQIFADPDVPVQVRFDDNYYSIYRRQWYPFTWSGNEAVAVTPRAGQHTVVYGALDVDGGFVGRFVDPFLLGASLVGRRTIVFLLATRRQFHGQAHGQCRHRRGALRRERGRLSRRPRPSVASCPVDRGARGFNRPVFDRHGSSPGRIGAGRR